MERSLGHSRKGTKKPPVWIGGFFVKSGASVSLFPLRRISTPHKINLINVSKRKMLSIWVLQLSHLPILYDQSLKSTLLTRSRVPFHNRTIVWGVVLLFIFYSYLNLLSLLKRQTDENQQNRNKNKACKNKKWWSFTGSINH